MAAFWTLLILLILVFAAIPVAAVLGMLSLTLDQLYFSGGLKNALGEFVWDKSKEFILVAVPMFILLGEIMLRAGIAQRMYNAVMQWLSWLPGGLMHANIGSCAIFAASSGSSVATAATVGTVAIPEIEKRRYNERLFLGTLAAGGTLGILIPPSINLIIYGLITETSVPELYLAGILPGLLLSGIFMVFIIACCIAKPAWGGEPVRTTWVERIRVLPDLLPPILLFVVVVGSIYAGIATPTEAASVGVVFAIALAAWHKSRAPARNAIDYAPLIVAFAMGVLAILGLNLLYAVTGSLLFNVVFSFVRKSPSFKFWFSVTAVIAVMGIVVVSDIFPKDYRIFIATAIVLATIAAAVSRGALSAGMFREAFLGTMRSTAMIMLIILAAVFLNFVLGFMGVTKSIIDFIAAMGLTPLETLLIIVGFYLILGMFMETLSMMLTTVPIVFPIVSGLGYDPVWFGILVTVLMEAALITPPIGVNLYVVHGVRNGRGKFSDVAIGSIPFVVAMIGLVFLLIAVPDLALMLPTMVYR